MLKNEDPDHGEPTIRTILFQLSLVEFKLVRSALLVCYKIS